VYLVNGNTNLEEKTADVGEFIVLENITSSSSGSAAQLGL
jgi:hypothetical protein